MVEQTCVLMILIIGSIQDLRNKELSAIFLGMTCALGVIYQIYGTNLTWIEVIGGALIGGVLMALGLLSQKQIGLGDGWILIGTGLFVGIWDNLCIFFGGTIGIGVVAAILYIGKFKSGKYELPFIPFLCGADIILLILRYGK